jgi:hypothetical protein
MTTYVKEIDNVLIPYGMYELQRDHPGTSFPDEITPPIIAEYGLIPLIRDSDAAPLGYADPVLETRDGQQVAVQYALGTPAERAMATARIKWAAQANTNKRKAALAEIAAPIDPTDPAALHARLAAITQLLGA